MNPQVARHLAPALLLLAACQQPAAAPQVTAAQFTAEDEATLRALFDSAASEISSKRWDEWGMHYSEDAVLYPPNEAARTGQPAIVAWGRTLPVESVSFPDPRVEGEGNFAWGTSGYVLKLIGRPADTGKQVVIWRRSAEGRWEVRAVSFNSNLPAAAVEKVPVRN